MGSQHSGQPPHLLLKRPPAAEGAWTVKAAAQHAIAMMDRFADVDLVRKLSYYALLALSHPAHEGSLLGAGLGPACRLTDRCLQLDHTTLACRQTGSGLPSLNAIVNELKPSPFGTSCHARRLEQPADRSDRAAGAGGPRRRRRRRHERRERRPVWLGPPCRIHQQVGHLAGDSGRFKQCVVLLPVCPWPSLPNLLPAQLHGLLTLRAGGAAMPSPSPCATICCSWPPAAISCCGTTCRVTAAQVRCG